MKDVGIVSPLTLDFIYSGISQMPKKGQEVYAENLILTLGGGAGTAACRLNCWNIPVKFGTLHGHGRLSNLALQICKEKGFPKIHNLYSGDSEPIIVSDVFSFSDDRGIITYEPPVKENCLSDETVYDFLKNSKIAVAPYRKDVVKKLHEDGTLLVYDVHCDENLTLRAQKDILEYVDYFTPNADEAMAIAKTSNIEKALEVLCDYTAFPIVKLGKDGCCAKINGEILYFVAPKVTCTDTTGAGDNFLSGLIYGLYKNEDIKKCITYANRAGAISTTKAGCLGADIALDDVTGEKQK